MNILITGGTGYLASHLINKIVDSYKIIITKYSYSDITGISNIFSKIDFIDIDIEPLEKVFIKYKINLVIHMATLYGKEKGDLSDMVECNIIQPLRLYDLSIRYGVKYFINTDTILNRHTNYYSLSKKQFLEWLPYWKGEIKILNIILDSFYGPDGRHTQFITSLVRQMLLNKRTINLTFGDQRRCFIYIDDLVSFYELIIKNINHYTEGYNEYCVSYANVAKLKEQITKIKKITNSNTKLNFGAIPLS
jgi:CDP-paratose synthetase